MCTGRAGVWPKNCACGKSWTRDEWSSLHYVARTPDHEGGMLEMRTCTCRSTLAVPVPAVDDAD